MGALVILESSSGVPPPSSMVLASERAGEVRAGLACRVLSLAGASQSSGLVLQSGLALGEGGSQMVSFSAVPWNLTIIPGGQSEWGKQRAQELVADVAQNMPARHSQTRGEFHEHGFFSTRSSPAQLTQAVQRPWALR